MNETFIVPKSHQRIIKEKRSIEKPKQFSMFGNPKNQSIKKSIVLRINFKTAATIILPYEWIGTMPLPKSCRFMYGIYFENVLGGAVVYVEPSTRQFYKNHPRKVVQLNRGATAHWTPKNTASRLIGQSFKYLRKEGVIAIIAYCTKEAGEIGTIYQACNFTFTGETKPSKTYFLDNHWVSERTLADKKKWAKNKGIDWINKFNNLPSKKLQGKLRYVHYIGTKKEKKDFFEFYNFQNLPYPKR